MNSFRTVFFLISLILVLPLILAQANEPATTSERSHHNTNFFPKLLPNRGKATRLPMVALLEPKAFSKISGGQVTLKWEDVVGAESYRVQVATDPNFKWLLKQEDFYKGNSYQVSGLESGKHYFWRVYAWKSGNDAGWMSSFAKFSSFEAL